MDFKERYGDSFASLGFWRIAARPVGTSPTNDEIQSMFSYWLETPLWASAAVVGRTRHPTRDFSAFGLI
jgi:hypothetical protein